MTLAWLAIAFLCGVWAGIEQSAVPTSLALTAGLLLTCAGALSAARRRQMLLVLAAVAFGIARAPHVAGHLSADQIGFYNGHPVQIQGSVSAEPDVRDTGTNYVVAASRVVFQGRSVPVSGAIRVHTSRSVQLDFGDNLVLRGLLRALPRGSVSPGGQGVESSMFFPRVQDQGPAATGWRGWLVRARQFLEAAINEWLAEPEASLLIAVALGAHSASLGDLTPILVSTGLIHVIAISGIKVALVAGTVYQLARRTGNRLLTLVLALVTLTVYVLLTGATASGERSALMWSMIFMAAFLGRGTVALVSLGVVAAAMVAFEPALLMDTGFLMSVAGTLGIVAFTGPLARRLRLLPSPWRDVLCVSAAAQIATLPIVIFGFHLVSIVSPVANAVVLPFLPALIVLGFVLGLAGGMASLAAPVAAFAYALLHIFIAVAREFARLPTSLTIHSPAPAWSALYYGVLAVAAVWLLRREGWVPIREWTGHRRDFSLAMLAGTCALTGWVVRPGTALHPRLDWLGSGESILLQDRGRTVLIDGSPRPFVLLEQLGKVLPFSTHDINAIVVTDGRASNLSGLQDVIQHYRVQEVLDVGVQYPSTTYTNWRELLRRRNIAVYALRTGAAVRLPDAVLESLGPDGLCANPRDCAGILRITLSGRSYLLVGSASAREQHEAVFRGVNLRSKVLVDSSGGPIDGAFLATVQPRFVASASPLPRVDLHLRAGAMQALYRGISRAREATVDKVGK